MTIEYSLLITGLAFAFSVFFGLISKRRNEKTDDKQEASQGAIMMTKLDNIEKGVGDIKKEFENLKKDVQQDHDKLTRLEVKFEQVFKLVPKEVV